MWSIIAKYPMIYFREIEGVLTRPSVVAEIDLDMRPANERRRYNVTTSLIGWAHT